MTDTTTSTTPVGTTTPVVPSPNDLQINLEENIPTAEVQASTSDLPPSTNINLDLDLNLPEAPKNDDRLKIEDENNETTKENTAPVTEPAAEPVTPAAEPVTPAAEPVIEPTAEIKEITTPDTSMNNLPEKNSLENDMKIIENIQGHESTGGLAPEANRPIQVTPQTIEAPKTFDLDAMLGTPAPTPVVAIPIENSSDRIYPVQATGGNIEEGVSTTDQIIPNTIEQKTETPNMIPDMATPAQPVPSAFTLPTPQTQVAVQAVPQVVTLTHKKFASVKTLLFVVLFAALGFTTFFVLKTMYPLEFAQVTEEEQIHTSADTGEIEESTGVIAPETTSGIIEDTIQESSGDDVFGELNDLETAVSEETTTLSRLTDYLNQGNAFREQGKTINNNTVIKYGLYISKKATSLLEKIANGEEITNLSGYFAQFDQYIAQLELLVNQTSIEPIAQQEPVSVTPPAINETPVVNEPITTQEQNNSFIAE